MVSISGVLDAAVSHRRTETRGHTGWTSLQLRGTREKALVEPCRVGDSWLQHLLSWIMACLALNWLGQLDCLSWQPSWQEHREVF